MTPGPELIYRCPECGEYAMRRSLTSGNTFSLEIYSDGYRHAQMLPEFPKIIKCKKCGSFFWLTDENFVKALDRFDFSVKPSKKFASLDAAPFLTIDEYAEAIETGFYKNSDEEKFLRTRLYWKINDTVRYERKKAIPAKYSKIFRQNCLKLADLLETGDPGDKLMKAEIYRNLGKFRECRNLLSELTGNEFLWIKRILENECGNKNKKVIWANQNDMILHKCPKCGKLARLYGLLPDYSSIFDYYRGLPDYTDQYKPEYPRIIKCKNCGNFYRRLSENFTEKNLFGTFDFFSGEMRKEYLDAERIADLTIDEYIEAINSKICNNKQNEKYLRIRLWWAINNTCRENKDALIPKKLIKIYDDNCNKLAALLSRKYAVDILMKAEIFRNLGKFDDCLKILETNGRETFSDELFFLGINPDLIKESIKKECKKKNKKVAVLKRRRMKPMENVPVN